MYLAGSRREITPYFIVSWIDIRENEADIFKYELSMYQNNDL